MQIPEPLDHLIKATQYSVAGLSSAFRHEPAFRQEIIVLVLVIPFGLWLGKSGTDRALLIGSWLLVIVVELINSAIEAVVDRMGLEQHPLAGRAKDLGSSAVFCAILLAITVWILLVVT
ncbi:MAG: diacylglycerol kinase [Candidatus Binatia bacterium]